MEVRSDRDLVRYQSDQLIMPGYFAANALPPSKATPCADIVRFTHVGCKVRSFL